MKKKAVTGAIFGVLVASCTALSSYQSGQEGPTYYLPQTLVQLTFSRPSPAHGDEPATTASVTAIPLTVSDVTQRYILRYSPSAMSDDRLCISRTSTGLLRRIYFSSDDRTDDFLLNVVQLAAEGAGDIPPTGSPTSIGAGSETIQLDPYDVEQLSAFNKRIAPYSVAFPKLPSGGMGHPFSCPQDAVCFATKVVVPIVLRLNGEFVSASSVEIVDPDGYGAVAVTRAFMTSKITKLDFDNGVLTSLRVRKDSEALAASEFPLKAIERALSVPGNGIALAFGTYEDKKALKQKRDDLQTKPVTHSPPADLIELDSCTQN